MSNISPQDLYLLLQNRRHIPFLLDLRKPEEFEYWHIYGSINIPQNALDKKSKLLTKNKEVIIIPDGSEHTKKIVSALQRKNIQVKILNGGIKAWNKVYDVIRIPQDKKSALTVFQIKRLGKGCLSYVLVLPDSKSAILIDPGLHSIVYETICREQNLKPVAVCDTHIHSDHITGARIFSKKHRVPYLLPRKSKVAFRFTPLEDGITKLMKYVPHKIIRTPGHTSESVSLLIDDTYLFTGDTLLVDLYGRPDIGEHAVRSRKQLKNSIMDRLYQLKDSVFVLPAHTSQFMIPGPIRGATMRYVKIIHKSRKSDYDAPKTIRSTPLPCIYKDKLQIIKNINLSGPLAYKGSFATLEEGSNLYCYPEK